MKKIVLVVASDGFQPIEYNTPKKILEAAKIQVITASDAAGQAQAKDGSTTPVDVTLEALEIKDYDGVFFVGGSGALICLDNQHSHRIIKDALAQKKLLGGICVATRILARAGVLTGKKATGWDGDGGLEDVYNEHHVIYIKEPVVIDGTIITAVGPDAAETFGNAIVAALGD